MIERNHPEPAVVMHVNQHALRTQVFSFQRIDVLQSTMVSPAHA